MEQPNQEKLLKEARSLKGTPYKYGVKPEEIPKFLDCSFFTKYIYKLIGFDLERSTILQATQGKEIPSLKEARIGDLLFFRGTKGHYNDELFPGRQICIGHVAMYMGNNKAIHAASGKGVVEENIAEIVKSRFPIVLIKRIL